ncbi:MAG: OmpA family protein [Bacteroidales bacterium]|jgi:outer membrane protein OmpA-like peptidoglycan-associated protein|nr:OmpA family protein [Bacteroidales bacterium]
MKRKILLPFLVTVLVVFLGSPVAAQISNPVESAKNRGTDRANSRIDQGIDAGFDKLEQGAARLFKRNNDTDEESGEESASEEEEQASDEGDDTGNSGNTNKPPAPQKLESFTQYDFVAGDKILYFEDFSLDQIGDFPALWTSNGSGEVKTVNIASGKWLHMNGEDAVYCYTRKIPFPDNFIIEFDIIPDSEYDYGIALTLYEEDPEDPKEINDDLYPGKSGLHITMKHDGWETKGYTNNPEGDWINGQATKNPVVREQLNHVIIWIQKRRVRIYHQGSKALDVPTNIYTHTKFDRFLFSGWDRNSWPMVTNLKITTASPDTRSKLITEGKLVTYGITFDVNKADIKPESYGTLKSIADVLKENPDVSVKITGHTDSDGDDAMNLDLSKRRAESVKSELTAKFGIEAARMETEGAGESKPVAPNDTPANKAMNRRVEFIKK